MKRFFIVVAVVCTVNMSSVSAQEMQTGMGLLNVGLGLVDGVGLNASYDHGIAQWGPGVFTIGGIVGLQTWGVGNGSYRANTFVFSSRATYRYPINSEFEVYATAMLGVQKYSYSNNTKGNFTEFFGTTAGIRYSFSSNIAVFAEAGYNLAYLNGGLSFSF